MVDSNLTSSMTPKQRKTLLYAGAGIAALAVVWFVMRRRSASPAAPSDTGYSDASGAATGYQQSLAGYYDPQSGQYISGVGATGVGSIFGPATNAAWAQQVEAYLVGLGHDPVATAAALGKYLTGQTMSADQAGIVQSALAFFGAPPLGAPPVSTAPASGQTNSFYPPEHTTGPGPGQAGNYWWTPATESDAANFALAAFPGANPANESSFRSRIMAANPQINWGAGDFRSLIGTAIYIPAATTGGAGSTHNEAPWALPPGASLDAPSSYHPLH